MDEESEKRFEAILEKLFQEPPKSSSSNRNDSSTSKPASVTSNAPGGELARGKRRPNVSSALALVGQKSRGSSIEELQNSTGVSGAACRPWDRDDLFRRLATFKSMTWFAKPEAVSAVNCSRRGWINIDMDIIACESCGARLLFSTPSSWTQQQVEKAALVFSLKLDTGHKLLCPWVDNICDEKLANFPPKPTAVLVEDYKKRCSILLHLTALPGISPSAIENMGSPELQQFLRGPSGVDKNKSADASYYQAQKLISLCGWEPHSLPYIVDCNVGKEDPSKIDNLANQSNQASNELNLSVVSCSSDSNIEDANDSQVSGRALFEPNSVTLKCRLCGASVGLWAFSSVQRPVEFLRLIGYTEVDGKDDTAQPNDGSSKNSLSGNENHAEGSKGMSEGFAASTSSNKQISNLSLTIAGGPPPAKQNYRATISLPVVGRILRARLSTNSVLTKDQEMPLAEINITDQGPNQINEVGFNKENQPEDLHTVGRLTADGEPVGNVESTKTDDTVVVDPNRLQMGEFSGKDVEDNATTGNTGASENSSGMVAEVAICKESDLQGDLQHDDAVKSGALAVDRNIACSTLAKNSERASVHESMEFDPIRQHRLFCPWIASSGNTSPGWKQTLSALLQHKEFSEIDSLPQNAPSSLIEVDDPIASIRKLFRSPPAKRMKHARAS